MAKVLVDVVLNDGEDSTVFGDSFSSNENVEVRNPMVSSPNLIGVNVEESYFDTFKSDSRIKSAEKTDAFKVSTIGTIPPLVTMNNKTAVTLTSAWDTSRPGSDFIPAQFYYDTDIIPSPPLSTQTKDWYYPHTPSSGAYIAIFDNAGLGITKGTSNPTLSVSEGNTLRIHPWTTYNIAEITSVVAPTAAATYNIATSAPTFSYYTVSGSDRNGSVSGNNATVTVNVGDTINFNLSNVSTVHPFFIRNSSGTVNVSTPAATGQGATGNGTVSWTPNTAGTYSYICGNHPNMKGTITVQNSPNSGYVIRRSDRANYEDTGVTSLNPTLNIEVGDTIELFNTGIYNGHPLYIKTSATTGTGNLVSTGQTYGQGGDGLGPYNTMVGWDTSQGSTVIPGTYYYQCGNHAGMGGQIIVHAAGTYSNHPMYIKTAPTTGTGNQVTNSMTGISGVLNQGTTTEANPLTVTFGSGSAGTYYYQCGLHAGMGGQINVVASEKNSLGTRTGANYTPDTGASYPNIDYSSQYTGRNVDIVTMEAQDNALPFTHANNHADYDSLTNPGTSRVIPVDWPGLSADNTQATVQNQILTDHGCGVLSVAGGTICGFAKHANLHQITSTGGDSFVDMYNALLSWHTGKAVNPATGTQNPTIAIGEVQWGTWWDTAYRIQDITAIVNYDSNTQTSTTIASRPAGGWGQAGSDLTPFLDVGIIPRQLKDPGNNEMYWVVGIPSASEYSALKQVMSNCNAAGIHMINGAANQGQTFRKFNDPLYENLCIEMDITQPYTRYNLVYDYDENNNWILKIETGNQYSGGAGQYWRVNWNYGIHGHNFGIDVAAGQNSEEWSVLDDYTCRGPGADIIGMGANTFSSNPVTTFAGQTQQWGMFSGTSCAAPTVVGKAACEIEKYFTFNNEYPTPAQLKEIVCQQHYFYGHREDDSYEKKHIVLSDSYIQSLTPYYTQANGVGTINWTSVNTPNSAAAHGTHFYGYARLCTLYEGQYINGWIGTVELAGTTRQKANLNVKGFERSQTRGVRPKSGGVYPRPKIGRHNQLPKLK